MRTKLENLFIAFENKHYAAVQADTDLSHCEDNNKYCSLENKARKFWEDLIEARKEFLDELKKVDNEKNI